MGVRRAEAAAAGDGLTPGLSVEPGSGLGGWSVVEESGIPGVAVECADIGKNTDGEGSSLGRH